MPKNEELLGGLVAVVVVAGVVYYISMRNPEAVPQSETQSPKDVWEVSYTATSNGLTGYKRFVDHFAAWQFINDHPGATKIPGTLRYLDNNHNPPDGKTAGQNGRWTPPSGYKLIGRYNNVGSIQGDPRFLWTLARLVQQAGITTLHIGDCYSSGHVANSAHKMGAAIDIYNDDEFNAIVEAAKVLGCPISWISRTPTSKGWPMFQLRKGIKTQYAYSSVNHNSHQHLYLPRPNWALTFTKFPGDK